MPGVEAAPPGGPSVRRLVALAVVALTALMVVGLQQRSTTADLVLAVPAADARLTTPPAVVSLTFSGVLDPAGTHVTVTGPDGLAYAAGVATVEGDTVAQEIEITGEGLVLVTYHGVLADGREASGQYQFLVGASPEVGQRVVPRDGHAHDGPGPLASLASLVIVISGVGVVIVAFVRPRRV